jgi:hypothetical protein
MRARQTGNLWMMISLGLAAPGRVKKSSRGFAIHKVDE